MDQDKGAVMSPTTKRGGYAPQAGPENPTPPGQRDASPEVQTVTMSLWENGWLGRVTLLAVPRVGDRLTIADGRCFKVLKVHHSEQSNSTFAQVIRKAEQKSAVPQIQLTVEEY